MLYYKVKPEYDNALYFNKTLIRNELYTDKELRRWLLTPTKTKKRITEEQYIKFRTTVFKEINVSTSNVYTSFGCRFEKSKV